MNAGMSALLAASTAVQMKKRDYPRDCRHRGPQGGWEDNTGEPGVRFKVWPCDRYNRNVTWRDCRGNQKAHQCAEPKDADAQ